MTQLTEARAGQAEALHNLLTLADPESFAELGSQPQHRCTALDMQRRRPPGDGVITGIGRVDDRPVAMFAQEPGVLGGSRGETHAAKIARIMTWARRARMPVVGLLDSGGARIQEGVGALDGYGAIFAGNVRESGRIPQLSLVLGPCAGGAVYSPALTAIVIRQRHRAHMFLTGPRVVGAVTHENIAAEQLGGAQMHERQTGLAQRVAADAAEALGLARRVLSHLPSSCFDEPPRALPADPDEMPPLPASPRQAYDVRGVICGVVDTGSFLELQRRFAPDIVIGVAPVEGAAGRVGAHQPPSPARAPDIPASEKAPRVVRLCDAVGLPTFPPVGPPPFLPR